MEKMPYRQEMDVHFPKRTIDPVVTTVTSDWREGLPVLAGSQVTLRELRASDAPSLCALLTTEEVSRFISPPPTTVDGFERFIAWTQRQRRAGSYVCFAVTIDSTDTAIGIFQLRELDPAAYWGTGVFQEGAELLVTFAFETVGVHRLEARAAVKNGRGNGALRKIGAIQEGLLRKSFMKDGEYLDQALWTILDEDWKEKQAWTAMANMIVH
jgi:RimJ/RimL family protein N-acetyltransferase